MTESEPQNAEAWRLLAQAEECFLNYAEARLCLKRAMTLSKTRNRADLKKLALYKEMKQAWGELRLAPAQLKALGEYLRDKLGNESSGRTLRWTESWLAEQRFKNIPDVIESIKLRGAFSDLQVLENLVRMG